MNRLGIVGGGRAAWSFGSAWKAAGGVISGISLRHGSRSPLIKLLDSTPSSTEQLARESDLLLLAVTDTALPEIGAQLPHAAPAIVFHASGAVPALAGGFSLHPLKALPAVGDPASLVGTLLVFEGDQFAVASAVARRLGARIESIDAKLKPLYHAAAVFASNYVALMLQISRELIPVPASDADLAALARSAIDNWLMQEGRGRFTGPAARGDRATLAAHSLALSESTELRELYERLAGEILRRMVARLE